MVTKYTSRLHFRVDVNELFENNMKKDVCTLMKRKNTLFLGSSISPLISLTNLIIIMVVTD